MPRGVRTAPLGRVTVAGSPYSVRVLQEGFSTPNPDGSFRADGSVTLVWGGGGPVTALVDTGGPWDRAALPRLLAEQGVTPGDVTDVVCTHGHSDHVGNLNLFPRARVLVGWDLSRGDGLYLPHRLSQGCPLLLDDSGHLEVTATPGHTPDHVSVIVRGTELGTVAVAGDVFERDGDEEEWRALSQDPVAQERSRRRLVALADVIVPGHGPAFRVLREWGDGGGGAGDNEEGDNGDGEGGASAGDEPRGRGDTD